ncbi:lignostilbene-alpha,beta-dioxygenase [Scytonema sp. HK-05]|uniref:carotenoid oxygenase family protein n=1 Tax=Scytonema sp. HK-05 TaxID=1137095 RepID=UPI000937D9AF|nr:carotenoid oxygenase family protein [Scytonema sp. HK-05]OKH60750.1 Apocarotenoid-15,15'-oxygenase [Scytonema sp. HK-05]BAY45041.1 lignostilbene-alpha,beta-dioxygenase [Scytonema sp. HK-05]
MQSFQLHKGVSTVSDKSYTHEDWQGGYESLKQEFDYWIDDVEGQIPPDLHGTLFRNGPGLLDINGQRIHHPFDGDGMICRITFSNGHAHFRNRFIHTQEYLEEQKAGKILYRGVFGTQKPGGWLSNAFDLKIKNTASTNVIYWGGKLLALWEGAEPYRLDPYTLETLGKERFKGVLSEGEGFGAHPRLDPSCAQKGGEPCLVNFSMKLGLSSKITIFEQDLQGSMVRKSAHSVPGFAPIHDFTITPNYCIFFQNPVVLDVIPFVLGMRAVADCMKFQSHQPTRITIIPRDPEAKGVQTLEAKSGFIFHHVNAYEMGEEVVVDSICYESIPTTLEPESDFRQVDFDAIKPGQLWRFYLNLKDKTVQRELLDSRHCDFPSMHPQKVGHPYRYFYICAAHAATGTAPPQALVKVDLESGERQIWSAAPRGFTGEPVFVPRPNSEREDDGWVLALVYDSEYHRSDVVILDAKDFNKGPIARLHLKHHVPYGLHGNFTSECFL